MKDNEITIILDDSFTPRAVSIKTSTKKLEFHIGDGTSSDNHGGGGRMTMWDGDTQITMHLPKAAVAAVREAFRNG